MRRSPYWDREVVCKSWRSLVYCPCTGRWHCPWSGTGPGDPGCHCHSWRSTERTGSSYTPATLCKQHTTNQLCNFKLPLIRADVVHYLNHCSICSNEARGRATHCFLWYASDCEILQERAVVWAINKQLHMPAIYSQSHLFPNTGVALLVMLIPPDRNYLFETSRKRLTCDQGPILHWAGHSSLLQGLLPSGRSLLQYLVCTERLMLSCRGWMQRTDRTWYPVFPQDLLQGSHSPVTQLGWWKESEQSKIQTVDL